MKFRQLLSSSRALFAGALLAPMIVRAETPAAPGSGETASAARHPAPLSLEVASDVPRSGEAARFSDWSVTAPVAADSDSTHTFSLIPPPSAAAPSDAPELWVNGTVVRRSERPAPTRWGATGRVHRLEMGSDADGFIAGIFLAESGSPDYLFSVTSEGFAEGVPRNGMVPVPEPTTALFGLALVGFCALARYGPRPKTENA